MPVRLPVALAAFAAALLSKESAFAAPLLLLLLRRDWRRSLWLAGVAVLAILPRLAIYGGLGGYTGVHFTFGWKTITGLLTRVLAVPQLAINSSAELPVWMRLAVGVFAIAIALACFRAVGSPARARLAAACALVAALPAVNVAGWTGPSMAGTRYLYLPGAFLFAVYAARLRTALLAALVAVNAAGVWHNIRVQRQVLDTAERIAMEVRRAAPPGTEEVALADVPSGLHGAILFREEVAARISEKLPGVRVTTGPPSSPHTLVYRWSTSP
jgi:hypothetical protein